MANADVRLNVCSTFWHPAKRQHLDRDLFGDLSGDLFGDLSGGVIG